MKKVFLLLYLLLVIEFCMPREKPGPDPEIPEIMLPVTSCSVPKAVPERIRLLADGKTLEMDTEAYLKGVLAAEMPASFPLEALKAQAVAARSYAIYCIGSGKHKNADLCSSSACCQAWQDEEQQKEKWGESYSVYAEKLGTAVDETAGEYLCYEGQAIFAAFHSSSAGYTENSSALWAELPYLVSVESPENYTDVPNYVSTLSCSPIDFRDTLLSAKHSADFTGNEENWIGETVRNESGRVEKILLGGEEFQGTQLRKLFSLRSTAFELAYSEGAFHFTVTGYGHGIGMSQYGAKHMAEEGHDYRSILAHYYPDTYLS